MLRQCLKEQAVINPACINLLAKLYENSNSRIRTDLGITRSIRILHGVNQWRSCIIDPILTDPSDNIA